MSAPALQPFKKLNSFHFMTLGSKSSSRIVHARPSHQISITKPKCSVPPSGALSPNAYLYKPPQPPLLLSYHHQKHSLLKAKQPTANHMSAPALRDPKGVVVTISRPCIKKRTPTMACFTVPKGLHHWYMSARRCSLQITHSLTSWSEVRVSQKLTKIPYGTHCMHKAKRDVIILNPKLAAKNVGCALPKLNKADA
jgi:hypothetical protein